MKPLIITAVIVLILIALSYMAWGDEIEDILPYLIQVESSGNPHAVGSVGERGVCQISSIVLREYNNDKYKNYITCYERGFLAEPLAYTKEDLFDPEINKKIGYWYLRKIRDHYLKDNYTIERMLASYNGGVTRMRRLLREGKDWQDMPKSTRAYVKKILKLYKATK